MVGGEFKTSLTKKSFKKLVEFITNKIVGKQTNESLEISHIWQQQSPEINKASIGGLGDNTIAYGYFNRRTETNKTPAHLTLKRLGDRISENHIKELPDGKLIDFRGEKTISIERGIRQCTLESYGISNPTFFSKSGANADSGVVGRKLIAERHGNGVPHGGGAFAGKDFTKGDKSLKLIADEIALQHNDYTKNEHTLVQLVCKYGENHFNSYTDTGEVSKEQFYNWISELERLYEQYAPVKPSDYLNYSDLRELENMILNLSGRDVLTSKLW